jgi:hypothetical protein
MAAKGEELMQRNGQAPPAEPAAEEPADEGANLLAGKYKDPQELEKAYLELQKKLGTPKEAEAQAAEAQAAESQAVEAVGQEAFDAMQQEFVEKGELSPATYQSLEAKGIPKAMVDSYIEGRKAVAEMQAQSVYAEVGGQEEYGALIEWAAQNLDSDEIEIFNGEVQSGNVTRAKIAVRNLTVRRDVSGKQPRRVEGKTSAASGEVFRSMAEVVSAMQNARYGNDPAYRADIEQRIARSGPLR